MNAPKNSNYAAVVVRIRQLKPLEGLDNLVAAPMLGNQALVDKGVQINELGIMFPPLCQLSERYTRENSLFRHSEYNADKTKTGYLEDTRRVRAIKLRGHRSDALFMPVSSLAFTGYDLSQLEEGMCFDELNGIEICRKYVVHRTEGSGKTKKNPTVKFVRVDEKLFPEVHDTDNFFREYDKLDKNADITVTQKLHGTSVRIGRVKVKRRLKLLESLVKRLGIKVDETEYDNVYGSHHVIKDVNNPNQQHYYDFDLWTAEGKKLDGLIPDGYVVYGELVGWVGEKPIQEHYTYNQVPGTAKLFIYRVVSINEQGRKLDLSWDAVKEFCDELGLTHVPEFYRGKLGAFDASSFMDTKYTERYANAVTLSKDSPCDEGVVIRMGNLHPRWLKAKSPVFIAHESKQQDQGKDDIEESGSTEAAA